MQQELKKFKKDIQVTVSVDVVAEKLYAMMDQNNPNAALLVNTVIGSSLSTGKIGFVYNAINGWVDEINVTVGKEYMIPMKELDCYRPSTGNNEFIVATVTEVDEYRDGYKINVSYSYWKRGNSIGDEDILVKSTSWVNHNSLANFIPTSEFDLPIGEKVEIIGPKILGKIDLSKR